MSLRTSIARPLHRPLVRSLSSGSTRAGKPFVNLLAIQGSSSTRRHSTRTSATATIHYAEGAWNHVQNRGRRFNWVRDMGAGAEGGAGQYHFGVTGATLQTMVADGNIIDRCVATCANAISNSDGGAIVGFQTGPNDLANGNSAAAIFARVQTAMDKFLAVDKLYPVITTIPPRLPNTGEDAILVQRLLLHDLIMAEYGSHPRVKVADLSGVLDRGDGFAESWAGDASNHPRQQAAMIAGNIIWDTILEEFEIPEAIDPFSLLQYARNPHPLLDGPNGSTATGWVKVDSNAGFPGTIAYSDWEQGARWARITAASGTSNNHTRLSQSPVGTLTPAPSAGDTCELFCVTRGVAGATIGLTRFHTTTSGTVHTQDTNTMNNLGQLDIDPYRALPFPDEDLLYSGLPFTMAAGMGEAFTDYRVYGNGAVDVALPMFCVNRPNNDFSGGA